MREVGWIERIDGGGEPTALHDGGELVVGRDAACDLRLDDEAVSRRHCRIRVDSGRCLIVDEASTHGTLLEGVPLPPREPAPLRDGSIVVVGATRLRVHLPGQDGSRVRLVGAARRPSGETFATRPTILLRLRVEDASERELSWAQFEEFYAPVILGFARRAGLAQEEAQDVLQDVLLGFFRASEAFRYDPARGRFRGYLKRAVLNAIRRRRGRPAPSALVEEAVAGDEDEAPWEAEWQRQVMQRAIDEVRGTVATRTWEAFELYAQRGVPAEEVARRLDISVDSVHQARSRVVRAARTIVERIRAEEG